jgi:hypothetical protein
MPDSIITDKPAKEPADEAPKADKPGLKDGSLTPIYEVLKHYRPPGDIRLYVPGSILNLEDVSREDIRRALRDKFIQTADGKPGNKPVSQKPPCRNC